VQSADSLLPIYAAITENFDSITIIMNYGLLRLNVNVKLLCCVELQRPTACSPANQSGGQKRPKRFKTQTFISFQAFSFQAFSVQHSALNFQLSTFNFQQQTFHFSLALFISHCTLQFLSLSFTVFGGRYDELIN
jgi:hypothetical protein